MGQQSLKSLSERPLETAQYKFCARQCQALKITRKRVEKNKTLFIFIFRCGCIALLMTKIQAQLVNKGQQLYTILTEVILAKLHSFVHPKISNQLQYLKSTTQSETQKIAMSLSSGSICIQESMQVCYQHRIAHYMIKSQPSLLTNGEQSGCASRELWEG